jgi:hypothetical protein
MRNLFDIVENRRFRSSEVQREVGSVRRGASFPACLRREASRPGYRHAKHSRATAIPHCGWRHVLSQWNPQRPAGKSLPAVAAVRKSSFPLARLRLRPTNGCSGACPQHASREPITTTADMDSGIAAARRRGMTPKKLTHMHRTCAEREAFRGASQCSRVAYRGAVRCISGQILRRTTNSSFRIAGGRYVSIPQRDWSETFSPLARRERHFEVHRSALGLHIGVPARCISGQVVRRTTNSSFRIAGGGRFDSIEFPTKPVGKSLPTCAGREIQACARSGAAHQRKRTPPVVDKTSLLR